MKWFKHYSDSLEDPFVQELMDEFGAQGYLFYFGLLEIFAAEMGSNLDGELELKPEYLRRKLRISSAKVEKLLNHCSTVMKLSANFSKGRWIISIPKMLELKDNYTKDLQGAGKKLSLEKEKDKEEEKEKRVCKKRTSPKVVEYSPEFEQFWDAYPRTVSKPKCYLTWKSLDMSNGLLHKILKAIGEQKMSRQWSDSQYIPNSLTWLNQHKWNDTLEPANKITKTAIFPKETKR